MTIKSRRYALLEQLLADGVDHIFGNPGTVEEGFLDALWDFPQLKYILTLQESIAVLTADGYARASGKPAVVQIHSTPGLGNSIGALYQAYRGHSPLVVLGGDAGVKYQSMDSQMAGDLVAFARPVTKWSTMVLDPSSLLRIIRRAIKIAMTPPMGPVYVCLPLDVLDAPAVEEIRPTSVPSTRVIPDPALVTEAARILAAAQTPMLYVGDGVAFSHAQPELTRVGDGGSMYTIQSLWTAVRHNVDAKFVICNNRSYRLLQVNMLAYWQERGMTPRDYPLSFDLSKPELRFVDLARGMGMEGVRIETVDQVGPAIRQALQHQGPFLLDVAIEGDVHPELIGVRCGQ